MVGAGGAARGVMMPLLEHEPCTLVIANRTNQKALRPTTTIFGHGNIVAVDYTDIRGEHFDLIINATSASLYGKLPPLPPGIFAARSLAYDMMYGDGRTPFLQFARKQGAEYLADGIGMLVEQAAESFFVWRGIRPRTDGDRNAAIMRRRLKSKIGRRSGLSALALAHSFFLLAEG